MIRVFKPVDGKRFSRFDLWIYRLFFWRWTKHFTDHPDLRKDFIGHMQKFDEKRSKPIGTLTSV